jgi:hypothetical protein
LRATAKQARLSRRSGPKSGGRRFANKKQSVTTLILLEKLSTEKEKRRCRFLTKNQVVTCGISERRFIQGDRPEAGTELAMTDRELAHLFLRVA